MRRLCCFGYLAASLTRYCCCCGYLAESLTRHCCCCGYLAEFLTRYCCCCGYLAARLGSRALQKPRPTEATPYISRALQQPRPTLDATYIRRAQQKTYTLLNRVLVRLNTFHPLYKKFSGKIDVSRETMVAGHWGHKSKILLVIAHIERTNSVI